MRVWRLSDDQFIARVRFWQTARRYWGAVFLILGIALAALSAYWGMQLYDQALEVTSSFQTIEQPTEDDMRAVEDETRFQLGLVLGYVIGKGLWGGTLLAIVGFGLVAFRDRKSQLLLNYWDRQSRDA